MERKLQKSNINKMLAGVCGGIGEFLGIDPTIVRLVWVLLSFLGGSGVIAYLVCMLIIPRSDIYPVA